MPSESQTTLAYVALGANLDDPEANIVAAASQLAALPEIYDFVLSPLYKTSPVSNIPQPDYFNAVCKFRTAYSAKTLLENLQLIEKELGKVPKSQSEPRPIDLDILFYGLESHADSNLTIPHPRWRERLFVVKPLSDLTEEVLVPESKRFGEIHRINIQQLAKLLTKISNEKVTR